VSSNQSLIQLTAGATSTNGGLPVPESPKEKELLIPEIKTDAQKHLMGLFSNMTFGGSKTDHTANGGGKS